MMRSRHLATFKLREQPILSADSEALKYWSTRIAARYMGEELAEAYGKRNSVEGELLVRGYANESCLYQGCGELNTILLLVISP